MAVQQAATHPQANFAPASSPGSHHQSQAISTRDYQEQELSGFLGWFSIGLGLAEVAATESVARLIGLHQPDNVLPVFGLREIASGIGILSQRRPATFLWSRVAGDMMDLAYLATACANPRNDRARLAMATAAVAGVTVLDILAAEQHSRRPHALAHKQPSGEISLRRHITINRSVRDLYQFWRKFENLPKIMRHLKEVKSTGEKTSHWVAHAPLGMTIGWDAEITQDLENRLIEWKTTSGLVHHSGSVQFNSAPGNRGTEMHVEVVYRVPGGLVSKTIAWASGEDPEFQIQEDLRRFKQVMETGEYPTTEGQPSGRGRSWIPGF